MKYIFLALFYLAGLYSAFGQKPAITIGSLETATYLANPLLNDDASFLVYTVLNTLPGKNKLVVKALASEWQKELEDATMPCFVNGNRLAYLKSNDSICIQTLGSEEIQYVSGVSKYNFISVGSHQFIAWQPKSSNNFVLWDLSINERKIFANVRSFFTGSGSKIVLITNDNELKVLDVLSDDVTNLTPMPDQHRFTLSNLIFDDDGIKIAYILQQDSLHFSIWYSDLITSTTTELLNNQKTNGLVIDNGSLSAFSRDASSLFISLKNMPGKDATSYSVKVDIWSYKDAKLQSEQLLEERNNRFMHTIDLEKQKLVRLQEDNEDFHFFMQRDHGDYAIVTYRKGTQTEEFWNADAKPMYFVINTKNGDRKQVAKQPVALSPDSKFVLCYDHYISDYFSYELVTGVLRNITRNIPVKAIDDQFDGYPHLTPRGFHGMADWMDGDSAILLYDQFDIWKVDLLAKKAAINLTDGYGRKNNISFNLLSRYFSGPIKQNDKLILSAFNKENKNNGFYSLIVGSKAPPKELYMGPYLFYVDYNQASFECNPVPLKAKNKNVFLVYRETAEEHSNFFTTSNFEIFKQASYVNPERGVNWLTSTLINYKGLEGRKMQGILYKPEDFDSTKQYPLIIACYEKFSDELHRYQTASPIIGSANIPWLVSQGYLIFTPDIRYKPGETGRCAYNSIIAAAQYLASKPFVSSKRMAIYGHSFGGLEANYIITHSTLFAAAISSSGSSNLISAYNSVAPETGISLQFFHETEQNRIGASLWERQDLYIENSPVLLADKVKTPLLMMNNKEDGFVPFNQGVEFFTGLRRLKKRVWMLQYDGQVHVVLGKEALDYTTRITQFLDHYLKEKPAPLWMTQGVPAKMKGIESGLSLDPRGVCGANCRICDKSRGVK